MKKFAGIVLTVSMVLALMTGCSVTTETTETGTDETTVTEAGPLRPQDDFYGYINQEFIANAEFEYGDQSVSIGFDQDLIDDEIETVINDVVAGGGYVPGSEEDIIKHAYDYYMAYDFENEEIPADLMAAIESIEAAESVDELLLADAAIVRDYGTNGLLQLTPDVNPFEPTSRVICFKPYSYVAGTAFSDIRDDAYALDSVKNNAALVLSTRGYDTETCDEYGTAVAGFALDLYENTDMDAAENPLDYSYYEIFNADEINAILSNIDISSYLTTIGFDDPSSYTYCTNDAGQLSKLNELFTDENLEVLKVIALDGIYTTYMSYIAPHYSQLIAYNGRDYHTPEEQAITEISFSFKAETDPLYVERFYSPETDAALRNMCDDIREGYRALISGAEWLSEGTREELLVKLDNIVYVTASDLERHDPAPYANIFGDNYYELYVNYTRQKTQEIIAEMDEPVSRTDAQMVMQEFNACYQPSYNNITITAAITNAPYFDANADYYTNLGGLGMVIAHEMGHAFDSNCILFDADGVYDPSWIPDEDMASLLERNEQAVSYFEDNFTVFGVYHVDGEQTLGENYADLGAMECITSLTHNDEERMLLFENFATIWCELNTDEAIINQIAYDPHSPALIRVNAVLSTTDAFYETYDVQEGDGMYIAPENRISRWY